MLRASDNTARPQAWLLRLNAHAAAKPRSSRVEMRYSMDADYPGYRTGGNVHGSHSDNVKTAANGYLCAFAA